MLRDPTVTCPWGYGSRLGVPLLKGDEFIEVGDGDLLHMFSGEVCEVSLRDRIRGALADYN